ncbi:hypothetical protein RvY_02504-2 [Ramazzottius varieornatus]|uniref:Uncharacterized protein n=1 Tax=Ramazzottius varieornatus TaxID=947166 RepID=A0A1D1UNP7_RAMVA|nr:hypothetical protein RvY_02504-2 [Ramazzottius varieornatus]
MIFCLLPNEAFRIEVLSSDWLTVSSEKVLHDFAVRWARVMMDGPCKGEREVDDVTKEVNEVFRFAFMKNEEPVSVRPLLQFVDGETCDCKKW